MFGEGIMEVSFTIDGLDRIDRASKEVQASVAKEMQKALYASALQIEKEAKLSITQGGKTGHIYKRGNVTHQASAAGEAPASDTGRLVNSIQSYLKASALESFVIAGRGLVKYAKMLEFGTSKIAARPFMFPASQKSKNWIQNRLQKAVIDGVLKVGKK